MYRALSSLSPAEAKELALYYGGDYELLATSHAGCDRNLLAKYSGDQTASRHRLT